MGGENLTVQRFSERCFFMLDNNGVLLFPIMSSKISLVHRRLNKWLSIREVWLVI